jgi:CubicO group peptidase (beta-lactamase class C family)
MRRDSAGGRLSLALLAIALVSSRASGASDEAVKRKIDAVFSDVQGVGEPGYAVGVVRGGDLWYGRGFGAANLDYRLPITTRSVFNLASLSKQFTATSLAILVRRGQVGLDDHVRKYLPEMPARFEAVRIAHLVYMTSGLPEYHGLARPGGRDWSMDYFSTSDAIASVFSQDALEFAPGSRWSYRNTNYQLIAEVVKRVSGVRFAEFSRREIFAPLGMTATHVNDDVARVVPERVTGYNRTTEGAYRREIRRSPHYGGSGVFSSIEDLARWVKSLRDHSLGGPALTELLLSTRRFDHAKVNDAFGLVWGEFEGHRTLWYEGGDAGFSAYMVRLPDDDLSVIVLSNLGTGNAAGRAGRVLRLLVE